SFNAAVCKLFIGGLCVNTNDDGLRKHFEQFGTLTDFVVLQNKNAQRSRCFGFVTYSTPEEANAAMAAAPHTVEGNSVEVKRAIPKAKDNKSEAPAKGEKIFVGGLKNNIEEYHLTDYFSWYGPVEKSEILLEKETGKKRGFGFVHFTHHNSADLALVVKGFGFVHFTHHKTADLALVEKYHTVNGHLVEVKKAVARQEMQAGNRTETTPRHRPGQCMMENQNGYCGLAYGECCCPCHLSYSKNGNRGYSYPQNRYRGSGYSYQENEHYNGGGYFQQCMPNHGRVGSGLGKAGQHHHRWSSEYGGRISGSCFCSCVVKRLCVPFKALYK
uniref:RRM domain-containing protein n=1 Tax=Oryzias latipes TaxID=8090 RepID=A0A3P9JV99_ORYLA